ncbi:PstS family phosphate ABC transporter substrate-binding protein [Paramaledivibacter caminithermalis]|uniref:Phosphate-binding protein n=1 Tax=Paramaledivibacter caminithermalis (strain DSM 15212 / CIP 107654 / DViRD3) TaxID=1121301 RepID=A0A1M6KTB0_PARC5|nr:PstS family phosphate ABC transporter substrate-binding protein [Paramaledivibacter caminithermalis]SHJ62173.1 phosphate ABC transporter substrate-binding protein, PhoT family (TC 3.A.1.7.1) [Paramaledivibacter caminithermalis DSM 15212]
MNLLKNSKLLALLLILSLALSLLAGCGEQATGKKDGDSSEQVNDQESNKLSGSVVIDGSSTVFPITEAVAEEFQKSNPDVRVTVGVSGTGGGFKKFLVKETDINDASRPIKEKEIKIAQENEIKYEEVKVAYDGLSVLVNPQNDWVDYLTVEELKMIWNKDSKVKTWKDVRPEWPDEEIKLYGPGSDSGTFDYFTEEINGEGGNIRPDYTASEDDNVLVTGIAGDKYALGFFGYAYYVENTDKIKAVAIDGGNGPVAPTSETIENGTYIPLSRPIFIYVNIEALERPEVKAFVEYYLTEGKEVIPDVGYVKLPQNLYDESLSKLGLK